MGLHEEKYTIQSSTNDEIYIVIITTPVITNPNMLMKILLLSYYIMCISN